jgi:hypothetical protein
MSRCVRPVVGLVGIALAATVALSQQSPTRPPAAAPQQFPAAVELVNVDLVVLDYNNLNLGPSRRTPGSG